AQVVLVLAIVVVLGVSIAADPIVKILGGSQYADAAPVLRIQIFALVGASLTQVWTLGLVAVDRQRALVITNGIALLAAITYGLILIPSLDAKGGASVTPRPDAKGASLAAACGELTLALATLFMLVRARPALRPDPRFLWRL